jgi:flagellar motor switch protein FliN/FliY
METQTIRAAVAGAIASAIGSLAGHPAEAAVSPGRPTGGWVATLSSAGDSPGRCNVAIGQAGAVALAGLAAPGQGRADEAAVTGVLRDVFARAIAGLAGRPDGERREFTLSTHEPRPDGISDENDAQGFAVTVEGLDAPLPLTVVWTPRGDGATAGPVDSAASGRRLDVILDIDLPVVVRFGHTQMPIRALSRLMPGSVIDLGRSPDDPVDILVSNRLVARGEVVVVGGNYGVRILDVTSQSERVRPMEV